MKLQSIESYKLYGIPRTAVMKHLFTKKHICVETQIALASYKLLVWNKELLAHKLHEGTITRFNKEYIVIWDWIDTRGSFISSPNESEWFLSFREPQPEYGLPNVVYVWRKYYDSI